ncbi:MAG: insulinase family protein, partial [Aridibacter sp.]
MKKIFLPTLLILSLFSNFTFAQTKNSPVVSNAEVKQALEVPFVNKTLANGLEVIVLPDKSVPLVTVEIAVRNGSFTEPLEFNGLSHLYEHMFFKPNKAIGIYRCESYAENARNDARFMQIFQSENCGEKLKLKSAIGNVNYLGDIGQMGITYNGTTREEVVNYYFTTTSPFVSTAIKFISDAIRFP